MLFNYYLVINLLKGVRVSQFINSLMNMPKLEIKVIFGTSHRFLSLTISSLSQSILLNPFLAKIL